MPRDSTPAPGASDLSETGTGAQSAAAEVASTLAVGTKVLVLSGPVSGQQGQIIEIDAKGLQAKVALGNPMGSLSVQVSLAELEVVEERRSRPALHSSHRRPVLKSKGR